jgi:hypothetical protein
LKHFTIHVPKGTDLQDRHGNRVQSEGVNVSLAAPTVEAALLLGSVIYATRIDEDPITTFITSPATKGSEILSELIERASDISGTIAIEGGVIVDNSESLELFISASENGKKRWLRMSGNGSNMSPWDVVEGLQKIF